MARPGPAAGRRWRRGLRRQGAAGRGAGARAEPSRSGRRRPARLAATMSVFGKLFGAGGGKAGKGGPTPQEAIQRLRDTEEMLSKKQEFLEKKIEQELTAAKKHGTKNKRGESAGPPQTPLAGLHLRQTCSSVCSDPGTLSYLVRLPSLPFWFRDPSPSDCLQCLPEPWTPASSHCHSSPLVSGSPHSARPLQTLISQLFFLFFRLLLFYLDNNRKIHPLGVRACRPKNGKRRAPQRAGESERESARLWGCQGAGSGETPGPLAPLFICFLSPWACPM